MNNAKSNATSGAKGKGRVEAKVSRALDRRLAAYSLAAATAGVGITALAQDSSHQTIQYTPADISFTGAARYGQPPIPLDLNHDGTVDFTVSAAGSGYSLGTAHISYYQGGAWWKGSNGALGLRRALTKGMWIGAGENFIGGNSLLRARMIHRNSHTYGHSHCWGPFEGSYSNQLQRYLGVAFSIEGQTHYGWIRIQARCSGLGQVTGYITGYAYNTVADAAIQAGQIRSGDAQTNQADLKGTLGMLALGSAGSN